MLDFLIVAPTPFYANRGCHLRIRGEAEALKKRGRSLIILTYKQGRDVSGLDIKRSTLSFGKFNKGVAASWKNIPNGIILFFSVLHETIYHRPKVIYGHLFEGAAIGIMVKYLAILLSLFSYKPILVLDAQDSLAHKMKEYGMLKNYFLLSIARLLERFILFFPDIIFASSLQCQKTLRSISSNKNIFYLPDGISLFEKNISQNKTSKLTSREEKKGVLLKIARSFSKNQYSLLGKWIKERKIIILYTGSHSPAKGFPNFMDKVLPRLLKNNHLGFLFGGGEIEKLPNGRELMQKYPKKIVSLSDLNLKNLPYFLMLGDIALDVKPPKTSESSGKILNYMAVGLPIVCFDQENNQFFLDKNGFYAKNEIELEKQIIYLAGNPNIRKKTGRENLKRAWKELTWDKTSKRMLKYLQPVINN